MRRRIRVRIEELRDHDRIIEIGHVEHDRTGAIGRIALVIEEEVALIFGEPSLVDDLRVRHGRLADPLGLLLVRHIDDVDRA